MLMDQNSIAYLQDLITGRLANLHQVLTSSILNLGENTFALGINASCIQAT